jgi:hypothetical protein
MDQLHHPRRLETLNGIRHTLHFRLPRLTRPAAQLVLIGPPGTRKITLSDQVILIEAVEPASHLHRAYQSASNFISVSIRFAVQRLKLCAEPNQNRKSISENASEHCIDGNSSSLG